MKALKDIQKGTSRKEFNFRLGAYRSTKENWRNRRLRQMLYRLRCKWLHKKSKRAFRRLYNFDVHSRRLIGDGKHVMAVEKGNINIHTYVDNKWKKWYLENVLYVPDLKVNLFSCGVCLAYAAGISEDKLFSILIKTIFYKKLDIVLTLQLRN